jgi:glycosyltransferase involved in cell wall biosynthesis
LDKQVQGKVSMVMTCYNKADDIGGMLDSILAQKWDNIELIMVNDGSTDGTGEIIAVYEHKVKARGYECVIIDQENAGCCTALRNGLAAVTGDYVCVVDADDELDEEYVSTLAGFLEENEDYDYTICDKLEYTYKDGKRVYSEFIPRYIDSDGSDMAELYLVDLCNPVSWIYMVRSVYFKKCAIVENFYLSPVSSYEPSFNIPLLANKGRMKFFPLPLYRFQICDVSHSRFKRFTDAETFHNEYLRACKKAITALPNSTADVYRKSYMTALASFQRYVWLSIHANSIPNCEEHKASNKRKAYDLAIHLLGLVNAGDNDWWMEHPDLTFPFFQTMLVPTNRINMTGKKIIGVAAKARKAAEIFPLIENLSFYELWDDNAMPGDKLCGHLIKKPDYDSLKGSETVFILTRKRTALEQIRESLSARDIKEVYDIDDIKKLLVFWL